MFEILFRKLFSDYRSNAVEVITRLEKRMDRNERMELFLQKRAEMFPRDPRGCIRFVFYFGIFFGYILTKENSQEINDLFEVKDLSDEAKKLLQ